jgi:hypothetical protein
MALAGAVELVEGHAAQNDEPEWIARAVRKQDGFELAELVAALDTRISELAEAAKAHPDHTKLHRGIEIMRKVARLMDPSGAETELKELAERIRVCISKSDNYAATAGKHLRQARERCREVGMDFNKWCGQANLGIKRSRIYQLMGPDPITAARRGENHTEEAGNVQPVDITQSQPVNVVAPTNLLAETEACEPCWDDESALVELKKIWVRSSPAARETFLLWTQAESSRALAFQAVQRIASEDRAAQAARL